MGRGVGTVGAAFVGIVVLLAGVSLGASASAEGFRPVRSPALVAPLRLAHHRGTSWRHRWSVWRQRPADMAIGCWGQMAVSSRMGTPTSTVRCPPLPVRTDPSPALLLPRRRRVLADQLLRPRRKLRRRCQRGGTRGYGSVPRCPGGGNRRNAHDQRCLAGGGRRGVFTLGDAHFYGSMGNARLNSPVVGMASTPDGKGYWLAAADGGVFSFGDAQFHGSMGNARLNSPVVGWPPPLTARGTGWQLPTAACSVSATPTSTARWGHSTAE